MPPFRLERRTTGSRKLPATGLGDDWRLTLLSGLLPLAGLFPRFPCSGDLTSLFPFGLGMRVGFGDVGGELRAAVATDAIVNNVTKDSHN